MPKVHIEKYTVRHYECDAYGHLNNANYLRFMQEAAFRASAAVGLDYATYRSMGNLWLIRETEIEYLHLIRANDEIEVHTWVIDARRVLSRRMYRFVDPISEKTLAQGYSDWVFIERDSQSTQRLSVNAPDGSGGGEGKGCRGMLSTLSSSGM